jgi:hypothetical protein
MIKTLDVNNSNESGNTNEPFDLHAGDYHGHGSRRGESTVREP